MSTPDIIIVCVTVLLLAGIAAQVLLARRPRPGTELAAVLEGVRRQHQPIVTGMAAVVTALEQLAAERAAPAPVLEALQVYAGRRVVIHTDDKRSIRGWLADPDAGDVVTLRNAEFLGEAGATELGGVQSVPRSRVSWYQVLGDDA